MTSTIPGENKPSLADEATERVHETAHDVKSRAREQLRMQLAERSTQVGEQTASAATAMRRASSQLREDGNERVAGIVDAVADRGQKLGQYLRDADGEHLLNDIEEFARRQPWVMVGGSAVIGFLGSRFIKASSHGRYHASRAYGGYPVRQQEGMTGQYTALPAAERSTGSGERVGR
jgi:ElaB/YqjD/DUF883 family membrane-anchored ribosome-binding protein